MYDHLVNNDAKLFRKDKRIKKKSQKIKQQKERADVTRRDIIWIQLSVKFIIYIQFQLPKLHILILIDKMYLLDDEIISYA